MMLIKWVIQIFCFLIIFSLSACKVKTDADNSKIGASIDSATSTIFRPLGNSSLTVPFVTWKLDRLTDFIALQEGVNEQYQTLIITREVVKNKKWEEFVNLPGQKPMNILLTIDWKGVPEPFKALAAEVIEIASKIPNKYLYQGKFVYVFIQPPPGQNNLSTFETSLPEITRTLYATGKVLYLGWVFENKMNLNEYSTLIDGQKDFFGVIVPHGMTVDRQWDSTFQVWDRKNIAVISTHVTQAFRDTNQKIESGYSLRSGALRWAARNTNINTTLWPIRQMTDKKMVIDAATRKVNTIQD